MLFRSHIPVGQIQTFAPSNITACDGAYGVITPASGAAGFSQGSQCTLTQVQESGASLFKIRKCTSGGVTFRIYTDASQTTLLQTITIDL